MAVWTISAQEGTGGTRVAAALAAAADVPLLDREALSLLAHEVDPALPQLDELEARFGRFTMLSLSAALSVGAAEAFQEVELRHKLPDLGRAVLGEAARSPCVIYVPAAFAALPDHPSAIHVRLCAPLECRIASYQREHLVDRRCAEKALKRDDHRRQAWVKSLYRVDIDDARHFSLVLDTSRFSAERLVEILLAAAGVQPALVAP
ncbi:MAG: AAA family ATPase [Gaiellaceae bacterium]